jgi:hypothetical protein
MLHNIIFNASTDNDLGKVIPLVKRKLRWRNLLFIYLYWYKHKIIQYWVIPILLRPQMNQLKIHRHQDALRKINIHQLKFKPIMILYTFFNGVFNHLSGFFIGIILVARNIEAIVTTNYTFTCITYLSLLSEVSRRMCLTLKFSPNSWLVIFWVF